MKHSRPLSPHLQVYRPQITSVLSILHRFTGLAFCFGLLFLVVWLASLAFNDNVFEFLQAFISSWIGLIVLFGWVFSLFFHLFNGIRHLMWDFGFGFDLKTVHLTGWLVVFLSFSFTGLVGIMALFCY